MFGLLHFLVGKIFDAPFLQKALTILHVDQEEIGEGRAKTSGYIAVIASAVLFGLMPVMTKAVYAAGGNAITAVFLRYSIAAAVLLLAGIVRGQSFRLQKNQLKDALLVSFLGYGATALLLYSSYPFIPSGMATIVHFVYPAMVILASILFFRERPGKVQVLSLCLSLTGVALCFNGEGSGSLAGVLLAFLSGVSYTFYILAIARSSLRHLSPLQLLFYLNLFGAILSFLLQKLFGGVRWQLSGIGWLAATGLGLIISVASVFLFQMGIKRVGPANAALLSTFEPLTSLVVGVIYFQEALSTRGIIGSTLILAAVILLALAPVPRPSDQPKSSAPN